MDDDYQLIAEFKNYFASFFGIPVTAGPEVYVEGVRKLASVNCVSLLQNDERELIPAFRKEQKGKEIGHFVHNLYMSMALTTARGIDTKPFDKRAFLGALSDLRKLTLTEPEEFMGELVKRFRSCGVAFVYLPI